MGAVRCRDNADAGGATVQRVLVERAFVLPSVQRLLLRYLPSELGYGNRNRGQYIKAGDVLVFTLEMINVKGEGKTID